MGIYNIQEQLTIQATSFPCDMYTTNSAKLAEVETSYISILSIPLSYSFSRWNSPQDIRFKKLLGAWPTVWEVFFAGPATTGGKEMIDWLAFS
uniref:Uncharacterized protein n=1 Tax=Rhizophora mucronata TaxID=61149 RepID=A0A2P2KA04_RHIMU